MLYLFLAEEVGRVKIGFTSKLDFKARLQATRTHCPCEVRVLAVSRGGRNREAALHARFASARVRGEWFTLTADLRHYITTSKRWHLLADGFLLAVEDREPLFAEHRKAHRGTWKERAVRRLVELYE